MAGLLGNLFDLNHDGKMSTSEKVAEIDFIMRAAKKAEADKIAAFGRMDETDDDLEVDDEAELGMNTFISCDVDDLDDEQVEALADAGVDMDDWDYMDDDEKMEAMEDAGIDGDW
ncbi:hypothetical protein [Hespellia stercorisuis]|uniref:Uncharacterized protein n=1 Tax=Hespellia stercorisuis DSM 15480 TaxID=1121950 RepID=A0A1M6W6B1_9FIRM|nr:hypothetical protein [Hespellia stercorisuis]SHK89036.1 hypothetical protein SAMN02745243_03941 [Hespellia stercorisuis DSM 15480]